MPVPSRHNRAYTVILLILGFISIMVACEMLFLSYWLPNSDPSANWVFQFIALVYGIYILAIAATLALRAWAPAAGRPANLALNILLLPVFPFGTAVGVYGLWKVDKDKPPTAG